MITLLGLVFYQSSATDMDSEPAYKLWLSGGYQKQLGTNTYKLNSLDSQDLNEISSSSGIPEKSLKSFFIPLTYSESYSFLGIGSEYTLNNQFSVTARAQIHPKRSTPLITSPNMDVSLLGNVFVDQGFFSVGLGTFYKNAHFDLHEQHIRYTQSNFMPKLILGAGVLISDTMMLNLESSFSNVSFPSLSMHNEFEPKDSLEYASKQLGSVIKPSSNVLLDASIALSYNLKKLQD